MATRAFIVVVLLSLTAGCVADLSGEREDLASSPMPDYWSMDTPWAFMRLDGDGQIETVFIVQFTEYPAETCSAGDSDPRQVDILHEAPSPPFISARERAYVLHGLSLTISLTADLCDAHTEWHGELTETGFVGTEIAGGMFGHDETARVYGIPLPPIP